MNESTSRPFKPPIILRFIQAAFRIFGVIFPRLVGRITLYFWSNPIHYKTPAFAQSIADKAKKTVLINDGLPITVYTWDNPGPAILFIHGWAGRGTQVAHCVEPLLKAGFKVISFDGPGHGETPGKTVDIFDFSKALLAIIHHVEPLHAVIAHSFGATIFTYSFKDSMKIDRVIFLAAPKDIQTPIRNMTRMFSIPKKAAENFIGRLKQKYDEQTMNRVSIVDSAKKIHRPALLMQDTTDHFVHVEEAKAIVNNWPEARLVITKGYGHNGMLASAEVTEEILEFLKS